jgi:hypothetical protein
MAEQTVPPGNRCPVWAFSPGGNIGIGTTLQALRRQMQRVMKKIRAKVWRNATNEQGTLAIQAAILACGILSGALSTDEMPFPGPGKRHSGTH